MTIRKTIEILKNPDNWNAYSTNEVEEACKVAVKFLSCHRIGRWEDSDIEGSILSKCSVCGYELGSYSFKFCPMCGSIMKSERNSK